MTRESMPSSLENLVLRYSVLHFSKKQINTFLLPEEESNPQLLSTAPDGFKYLLSYVPENIYTIIYIIINYK